MRILVLCPHFAPDLHAATGEVMTELVRSLAQRGHVVDVVTSLPWYRNHDVEPEWRGRPVRSEVTEFGSVTRVWPFPTDKGNVVSRSLAFAAQTALSLAVAMPKQRPDVVLAMSPPIFFGTAGRLLARRFRVPFVFNVQDIFPDVAVDLGMLTNERAIKFARRLERSLYDSADAVTVLSEDQARNVRTKMTQPEKVEIIPNFVDTSRVRVVDRMTEYRRRHGIGDEVVVMYSGNVGFSQSFHLVEAAANHFASRSDVRFVINGEGAGRADVERWAEHLPNVIVSDFARREEVSDVLGTADIHLILLRAGLAQSSTPSKLYGILAAGRPVLASIDLGSDADQVIHRSGAGLTVPPDDATAFIEALEELLPDRARLEQLGRRAQEFVGQLLTPDQQAQSYEHLFVRLGSR
jgi:colanic acid biosynthesis glycosyl transferase WcaI